MLAGGCAPFGDSHTIGPEEAIVSRPDGPAATLAVTPGGVVLAYATASPGGSHIETVALEDGPFPSAIQGVRVSGDAGRRRHPPLALAHDDAPTIAWRETSPGAPGRLVWVERSPGTGYSKPSELRSAVGSDPRGGGSPPTLIATAGKPPGPRSARSRELELWQRSRSAASGWQPLGRIRAVRPALFDVVGTSQDAFSAAAPDENFDLGFYAAGPGHDVSRVGRAGKISGPRPTWLSFADGIAIAGWSEWSQTRRASVRVARSSDRGLSWAEPLILEDGRGGPHPLATFAREQRTVAATWVRGTPHGPRIAVAVSTDAGRSFAPAAVLVPSGGSGHAPARPRIAVRGQRLLVVWQSDGSDGGVHAAASENLGASWDVGPLRLDRRAAGRTARNPQPWLGPESTGGVLWESVASEDPGALPVPRQRAPRVSLHMRLLR